MCVRIIISSLQQLAFIYYHYLIPIFRLALLKARVQEARMSAPLFDTQQYTKDLETLFIKMWERYEKGLPPDNLQIS